MSDTTSADRFGRQLRDALSYPFGSGGARSRLVLSAS